MTPLEEITWKVIEHDDGMDEYDILIMAVGSVDVMEPHEAWAKQYDHARQNGAKEFVGTYLLPKGLYVSVRERGTPTWERKNAYLSIDGDFCYGIGFFLEDGEVIETRRMFPFSLLGDLHK